MKSSFGNMLQESSSISFKAFRLDVGPPLLITFNKSSMYILLHGKLDVEPFVYCCHSPTVDTWMLIWRYCSTCADDFPWQERMISLTAS